MAKIRLNDIRTHSFIEKESRLLQYVRDRSLVDLDKTEMDFSVFEKDVLERRIRIPKLKELYERKRASLHAFQMGKDIWKSSYGRCRGAFCFRDSMLRNTHGDASI